MVRDFVQSSMHKGLLTCLFISGLCLSACSGDGAESGAHGSKKAGAHGKAKASHGQKSEKCKSGHGEPCADEDQPKKRVNRYRVGSAATSRIEWEDFGLRGECGICDSEE